MIDLRKPFSNLPRPEPKPEEPKVEPYFEPIDASGRVDFHPPPPPLPPPPTYGPLGDEAMRSFRLTPEQRDWIIEGERIGMFRAANVIYQKGLYSIDGWLEATIEIPL